MNIVIDASCAMEIVLERGHSASLRQAIEQATFVLVPEIFTAEVTNSLWKCHRFLQMEPAACFRALDLAYDLVDGFVPNRQLARDALTLSIDAGVAAYDMFYLALAIRENAKLLTLDAKLRKEAGRRGIATH